MTALLLLTLVLPAAGALLALAVYKRSDRTARIIAAVAAGAAFVTSVPLYWHRSAAGWVAFQDGSRPLAPITPWHEINVSWAPLIELRFHIGVDGISYFTCTVFPVARAASRFEIQNSGAPGASRNAGGRLGLLSSTAPCAARLVITMTSRPSMTSTTPIIRSVELKKLWSVDSLCRSAAVRTATRASNSRLAYLCVVCQIMVAAIQDARITSDRLKRPG